MEDPPPPDADAAEVAEQQSIGSTLRAGRDALELSAEDVAARMNLDERLIVALEADDYGSIGASTFIRGYIRNYARLVNRDPEPLLAQFDKGAPQAPEVQPYSSRPATQARSGDRPVKAMTYSVVAVLCALLAIWWHSEYGSGVEIEGGTSALSADQAETAISGYNLDYSYPIVVHPDTLPPRHPVEPEPEYVPVQEPPPPSQALSITLSDEAWIEIYDARGDRLYYDLGKPAEQIEVTGSRPYRVKIGRASAAVVEYQGAVLDLQPFAMRGVAKFEVGDDGISEQ